MTKKSNSLFSDIIPDEQIFSTLIGVQAEYKNGNFDSALTLLKTLVSEDNTRKSFYDYYNKQTKDVQNLIDENVKSNSFRTQLNDFDNRLSQGLSGVEEPKQVIKEVHNELIDLLEIVDDRMKEYIRETTDEMDADKFELMEQDLTRL